MSQWTFLLRLSKLKANEFSNHLASSVVKTSPGVGHRIRVQYYKGAQERKSVCNFLTIARIMQDLMTIVNECCSNTLAGDNDMVLLAVCETGIKGWEGWLYDGKV